METKLIFFISTILLFSLSHISNSKFLENKNNQKQNQTPVEIILNKEIFGISTLCNNHILGNNIAEFQIMKSSHTFVSFDIKKNFDLLGIIDDEKSNPDNIKIFNVVVDHQKKLRATFYIDSNNNIHKEPQKTLIGINNYLVPCLMWVENFLSISEFYKKTSEVEISEEEKKMGDVKYSYLNRESREKITFNYFLKESNLKFMNQVNPIMGPKPYLNMEILDSRIMEEAELEKLPEGLLWEDLD